MLVGQLKKLFPAQRRLPAEWRYGLNFGDKNIVSFHRWLSDVGVKLGLGCGFIVGLYRDVDCQPDVVGFAVVNGFVVVVLARLGIVSGSPASLLHCLVAFGAVHTYSLSKSGVVQHHLTG